MLTSPFRRRLILLASGLFLGGIVLGSLLMPRSAFSQATTPQGVAKAAAAQCSVATFKGTYVFAADGVQVVGKDRVPFAIAGLGTYDGSGNTQATYSVSANGQISRYIHLTGTYTVKPDCTATETDKDTTGAVSHFDEWITPDGSLASFVQTDTGTVLSGYESRGTGK
jgi:hypothetical protein